MPNSPITRHEKRARLFTSGFLRSTMLPATLFTSKTPRPSVKPLKNSVPPLSRQARFFRPGRTLFLPPTLPNSGSSRITFPPTIFRRSSRRLPPRQEKPSLPSSLPLIPNRLPPLQSGKPTTPPSRMAPPSLSKCSTPTFAGSSGQTSLFSSLPFACSG